MNVVMIGSGYVGLVSGACFAEFGANVVCLDVDEGKIERLNAGEIPIYEPGLEALVASNVKQGRLSFSTDFEHVRAADCVFIAVGTPTRRGDGHADLSYVYAAAKQVAEYLEGYTVIVDKSTVPVGVPGRSNESSKRPIQTPISTSPRTPSFLREGAAISDFMRPDRVVLGVESDRAADTLRSLYRPLNLIETPIMVVNLESAELIKYAANAFLATKISFINEMSVLCEAVGAGCARCLQRYGIGRANWPQIHPGPGYGGSCFPQGHVGVGSNRAGERRLMSYR